MNIKYEEQYRMGSKAFDIKIENNDIMEYDGRQHFMFVEFFHREEKGLIDQQRRDIKYTIKALKAGYRVLRINYEIKDIDEIEDVIQMFFDNKEYQLMLTSNTLYKHINDAVSKELPDIKIATISY